MKIMHARSTMWDISLKPENTQNDALSYEEAWTPDHGVLDKIALALIKPSFFHILDTNAFRTTPSLGTGW